MTVWTASVQSSDDYSRPAGDGGIVKVDVKRTGSAADEAMPPTSDLDDTCDGYPCRVNGKADAETVCVRPHLLPNTLYLGKSIPIGGVGHEAWTCRFGRDPKTSVLDTYCKAHELDNLYGVDRSMSSTRSFFVSSGTVNPSLTVMAMALRLGDHLTDRLG